MHQTSWLPWAWLQQWFGTFGALVFSLLALGVVLSWCLTPFGSGSCTASFSW